MLTIIPILLLLLTSAVMVVIRLVRPKFAYFWLVAATGSLLTWLVVVASGFRLPYTLTLARWSLEGVFPASPALIQDSISWPFSLALTTLSMSVILTAVARIQSADWREWASSLALAAFGLLAVQAWNPLTVLIAWSALDMLELVILLTYVSDTSSREDIIISFAARACGIILLVGAILVASAAGKNLAFASIPAEASILLLLAASLRLGALPLHLPFLQELPLRRGLGTTLRLIAAAASLSLLARTATVGVASILGPWLLLLASLAALYGAWSWASNSDELAGRPFWLLATAGMAVSAALRAQPAASLAWGLTCLFSGGLLFLNSVRTRNTLIFSAFGLLGLSALPFTPNWNGMNLYNPSPVIHLSPLPSLLLSLISLSAHALLLTGYARYMLKEAEPPQGYERWVWIIYPLGLAVLMIPDYALGILTRPGLKAMTATNWAAGAAACILAGLFWYLSSRRIPIPRRAMNMARRLFSLDWLYRSVRIVYHSLRGTIDWITGILEGDGGILWAMLLLVLLLSLMARQALGG